MHNLNNVGLDNFSQAMSTNLMENDKPKFEILTTMLDHLGYRLAVVAK